MMIVEDNAANSVIDGQWVDETVVTEGSTTGPITYDSGTFMVLTGSSESRTWAFYPAIAFGDVVYETSVAAESGGIRLARVTSRGASREFRLDVSVTSGVTQQIFTGFAAATYGDYVANIIMPMLAAEGAEIALFNGSATKWNRSCWGDSFDLSGIVVRSSYAGGWTKERGGFLITPRHVVCANHYQIGVGRQVRFIKKGASAELDEVVTRTLSAGTRFDWDNYIYLLDSDVPEGIEPFPYCEASGRAPAVMCGKLSDLVLATASDYSQLNSQSLDSRLAAFVIPAANGSYGSTYTTTGLAAFITEWMPFYDGLEAFIRPILSGDSGSPHLIVIDGTTLGFRAVSEGTNPTSLNAAIAAVDSRGGVSTGYTVTVVEDPTP